MKGIAKRLGILSVCMLLTCAMIVGVSAAATEDCPGECTHQAAVGTTHYDTLEEAIDAAESGSTVKLLQDVSVTSALTIDKKLTLNLGGKTLTAEQTALEVTGNATVSNGSIHSKNGSSAHVTKGTLTVNSNAALSGDGFAPALYLQTSGSDTAKAHVYGSVKTKGVPAAISCVSSQKGSCQLYVYESASIFGDPATAIEMDCAGKLEISGGSIRSSRNTITLNILKDRKLEASVTGGTILNDREKSIAVTAEEGAEVPKDFVTGGTFNVVPSDYVPSYCIIWDNSDGTYTVISSYKITFKAGDGSGSMDSAKVRCGDTYKLPKSGFTAPKGKDFAGWEIGGKTYKAGDKFTPEGDTTVTALWKDHVHSGGKATCQKKAVCKGCGKSYGSKGSHNLVNYSGYAATCTEAGMCEHSKCSTCGKYFVSGISISASDLAMPALGHNWQSVDGKPATCTEDGLHAHEKCANCGMLQLEGSPVAEDTLLIAPTGHALEEVAASQATCTEPGIQAHEHCTNCDGQFLKGQAVEAAQLITATSSHVLSEWVCDELYHWKTCLDCQEAFRQSSHADTDADGNCDECGYAMAVSNKESDSESGFSRMFLIPIIAVVLISAGVAIPLAIKKRK